MDSLPSFVAPQPPPPVGNPPGDGALPDFVTATPGFVASDGLPSFVNASSRPDSGFVNGVESVGKVVSNAVADVFSTPLGPSEKDLAPFVQGGFSGPVGDLVHSFNRAVLTNGGVALDLTQRVGTAALMAGAAAAGETARQLGMDDASAGRLTRDLVGLGISAGVVLGSRPAAPKFSEFTGVDAPEGAATTVDAATRSAPDVGAEASAAPSATPPEGVRVATPEEAGTMGASPYGQVPPAPQRLVDWIRANGGVQDAGGDIRHVLGGAKYRPGLINNKSGMTLDDAALKAWEDGFIPGADRPQINDLLDAVTKDLKGDPQFSERDSAAAADYHAALGHNQEIDELASRFDLDPANKTRAQFLDAAASRMSQDQLASEISSQSAAHESAFKEAEKSAQAWVASRGDAWEPDSFYAKSNPQTLADLENEYQQEAASRAAQEVPGGAGPSGPSAADTGPIQESAGSRGGGAGAPGSAAQAGESGSVNSAIGDVKALGDDLAKSGAIDEAVSSLPPEMQAGAKADLVQAFHDGVASAAEDAAPPPPSDIKTPLTEERIAQPISKNVVDAAGALLEAGNVTRDPARLLSDQILELLQTERLSSDQISQVLQDHNVTGAELGQLWRVDVTKSAQTLQSLSAISRRLGALQGDVGDGIATDTRAMGWFRRIDNLRRGLMVSQLSTAARNFVSQVGRVGLDTLEQGLSYSLRRVFGQTTHLESPTDAFASVMGLFRPFKTKAEVDDILGRFPVENDALWQNVMSDIVVKGGAGDILSKAETGVRVLNAANQLQEYVVRRAAFAASLDRRLARQGLDLGDIIDKNAIGAIPRDAIKGAVNDALELTFAKNFSPMADGAEGLAGNFIRLVNGIPGASFILPFPRFLMNAVKFQYEFSPAGFLKLTSAAERAKIASGDLSTISRATLGSAMLLGAYQLRNSGYAGEKWYELKLPDGRTVDTRPYNPFASYLFVADIAKRLREGTLDKLQTSDIVQGVLSTNMRAGAGLYVVDSILNGLSGLGSKEKALRAIQDLAGNVAATFLVPLSQISEVMAEFDGKAAILRSTREGPYVGFGQGAGPAPAVGINAGPAMRMIPGLQNNLPPVQLPTRSAPPTQEAPMLKLLTGISLNNPKNAGESEIARLGFTTQDVAPSTGDPKADRFVNSKMGALFEHVIVPLVEAPGYQRLSDTAKPLVMAEALHAIHGIAEKQAAAENPAYFGKLKLEAIPTRERRLIESITGRPVGDLIPAQ
jgi:hypothetical protein